MEAVQIYDEEKEEPNGKTLAFENVLALDEAE